ncbi:unnamed protein product [Microthlaspi erraticum]|uniref:Uncharacterized protein n=1 Tax=Microthlaspi erraticum TaxID=1685480 RepID=A0A6D2HFB4_9BRAS|nr:unnamed protein product [Microthlaspi erraticum]
MSNGLDRAEMGRTTTVSLIRRIKRVEPLRAEGGNPGFEFKDLRSRMGLLLLSFSGRKLRREELRGDFRLWRYRLRLFVVDLELGLVCGGCCAVVRRVLHCASSSPLISFALQPRIKVSA